VNYLERLKARGERLACQVAGYRHGQGMGKSGGSFEQDGRYIASKAGHADTHAMMAQLAEALAPWVLSKDIQDHYADEPDEWTYCGWPLGKYRAAARALAAFEAYLGEEGK